jgi:hypothetical protein
MESKNNFLKLLGLIGAGVLINELLFSTKASPKLNVSRNSNCTKEFLTFNNKITLSAERVENLKRAHTTIRKKFVIILTKIQIFLNLIFSFKALTK